MEDQVQVLQQALAHLHDPSSDAVTKKAAESLLLRFQASDGAWTASLVLLSTSDTNAQFFGSQTLCNKLRDSWATFPPQLVEDIQRALVEFASSPERSRWQWFLTAKAVQAFVMLVLRARPADPQTLIQDAVRLFGSKMSAAEAAGDTAAAIHFTKAMLETTALVPEEAGRIELPEPAKRRLMADIQSLSLPSMEISIAACSSQDSGVRKLAQRNIVSWLQNELLPVEALVQVLQTLLVLLDGGPDFEQTADAVAEVLSEHRLRRLTETVVTMALPALTSARMRERLAAAISEEDEGVARVICKMLAEMAENNTEYLWDHILEEHVQALLAMLLDIVSFPGFHGVDQNVSQLPFYFWFVFQEAVSQGIELLPADDRNPKSDAKEAVAMQLFQQLLERLCLQAQFPPAAELQSWKNEARDQFRSHRRECSETMLCCFYVLKTRALQLLVATLGNKISTQSRTEEIEAVIFALKACNEAVDSDESVFLPQVVQASTLQSINTICIQSDTTGQLRNTTLAFIGAYAEWLSRHPDCLPAVFEFLLASLSNARSHSAAASALREVCDLCRLSLAPYADQVINACLAVLPLPDPPSHGKIIESLSMVIQALPATDASPRLNMVLGGILTDLAAAIKQVHGPTATNEQRIAILCQLGYLRSCCHGAGPVGISIAALVDLVEPVPRPSQQEQEIGANIAHAIRITISTWPQDDQMVQGACAVLSQVARSRLPYLVDEGEPLLAFLLESFKATPQTCLLRALVTLSEYMCGVHEDRGDAIRQQLFMAVCTHLLVCFDSIVFLENHPDVVDEFVKLLQKYLSSHGTLVAAMDANVVTAVFATVFLQGLRLQERLAVTAVLKLLTEFVDAGFESSPVESVVKRVLSVSGPSILSGLVVALGGGQPRSLNDKIADVLFAFVAKFPSEARQGLTQCLAAPGFPTQHVSEQDKAKFVKAISSTRQRKQFRLAVAAFSTQCWGLGAVGFS